jgi:hypothetical protein
MILGKMIDVVMWEAVTGGPGLCVPWQLCFLPSNIVAGACFGYSKSQPIILPSFISFCEFLTGSEFFCHPAKRG